MAQPESEIIQSVLEGLEKRVDENLVDLDLDKVRQARLKALKQRATDEVEWRANGHGEYTELPHESEFMSVIEKSKNIVLHFYREEMQRCKIVDKHLAILAPQFIGTKFVKIDAEKSKFLTTRFKIAVLPSIIGIVDKVVVDRIIGFTELGNTDNFTTQDLKIRLGLNGVIDYNPETSPSARRKMKEEFKQGRRRPNLRDSPSDVSDDDDFGDGDSTPQAEIAAAQKNRTTDFEAALAELDLDN